MKPFVITKRLTISHLTNKNLRTLVDDSHQKVAEWQWKTLEISVASGNLDPLIVARVLLPMLCDKLGRCEKCGTHNKDHFPAAKTSKTIRYVWNHVLD